jgi:hypothetical protein
LRCIAEDGGIQVGGESTFTLAAMEARHVPAVIGVFDAFIFDCCATVLANIRSVASLEESLTVPTMPFLARHFHKFSE